MYNEIDKIIRLYFKSFWSLFWNWLIILYEFSWGVAKINFDFVFSIIFSFHINSVWKINVLRTINIICQQKIYLKNYFQYWKLKNYHGLLFVKVINLLSVDCRARLKAPLSLFRSSIQSFHCLYAYNFS